MESNLAILVSLNVSNWPKTFSLDAFSHLAIRSKTVIIQIRLDSCLFFPVTEQDKKRIGDKPPVISEDGNSLEQIGNLTEDDEQITEKGEHTSRLQSSSSLRDESSENAEDLLGKNRA